MSLELGHFYRCYRGFVPFIAQFPAAAVQTLLLRVVCEHTKYNGRFAVGIEFGDAMSDPLAHEVEVSGFAL